MAVGTLGDNRPQHTVVFPDRKPVEEGSFKLAHRRQRHACLTCGRKLDAGHIGHRRLPEQSPGVSGDHGHTGRRE